MHCLILGSPCGRGTPAPGPGTCWRSQPSLLARALTNPPHSTQATSPRNRESSRYCGKTILGPELPDTLPVGRVLPDSPPLTWWRAPPRLSTTSCSWSPQEPRDRHTGRWPCQPQPPPLGAPPHPHGAPPFPCTEEHKQPCQTSRRTQPARNIQNTGSGGTGTGRPDAGAVKREKVQAPLPSFPDWSPRVPADEGHGRGAASPPRASGCPPYPPAPHPVGPPSRPNQVA